MPPTPARPRRAVPPSVATRLAVTGVVAALALTGCSSGSAKDGSGASASASTTSASSPSPTSTVSVPAGQELTAQGTKLSFGKPATVVFEPSAGHGTVLRLTVLGVRKGRLSDFKGFILDDSYKRKAHYFYARVKVQNVGEGGVGGAAIPVYGVNGSDTLLPAVSFTTPFAPCASQKLPKKFAAGASVSTCLVYLSPRGGSLVSTTFRPTQEFDPITWTGTIDPAKAVKKPAAKKKGAGKG